MSLRISSNSLTLFTLKRVTTFTTRSLTIIIIMPRQLRSSAKTTSATPYTKPAKPSKGAISSKPPAPTQEYMELPPLGPPPPPSEPPGQKKITTPQTPESSSILFASPSKFEEWLSENIARGHASSAGHWLRLAKKSCPTPDLTYDQALPIALAHGWIDGQRKSLPDDGHHFIQRFTPRRKNSLWSKRNVGIVEGLIEEGKMAERGMEEVQAAKYDGRWAKAYSGGKDIQTPVDLEGLLKGNGKAWETWEGLGRGERYSMLMRLETLRSAKGREKKMKEFVQSLTEGKTS